MDLNYDGGSWWGTFDKNNKNVLNRTLSNWQAVGKIIFSKPMLEVV
jgi:iron complex outermembrane receptor protein